MSRDPRRCVHPQVPALRRCPQLMPTSRFPRSRLATSANRLAHSHRRTNPASRAALMSAPRHGSGRPPCRRHRNGPTRRHLASPSVAERWRARGGRRDRVVAVGIVGSVGGGRRKRSSGGDVFAFRAERGALARTRRDARCGGAQSPRRPGATAAIRADATSPPSMTATRAGEAPTRSESGSCCCSSIAAPATVAGGLPLLPVKLSRIPCHG